MKSALDERLLHRFRSWKRIIPRRRNMKVHHTTIIKRLALSSCGFAIAAVTLVHAASAAETRIPAGKPAVPCAVLERFDGDVQILDSSRNELIYTNLGAPVPCGAWVTVGQGWGELRHKDGH